LEARFLEEVGEVKPTPFLYKPGLLRPMDSHSEESYAEGKPSQSQFDAEKHLRWRRCRIVSGSLEHQFCMSFFLQGSRDLGEQDQISLVAIWHCSNVILRTWAEIQKPSPQGKRPRDVGKHCVELRYQPVFLWFSIHYSFQICICVFDWNNPLLSSLFH
jgi:hypothetical protein